MSAALRLAAALPLAVGVWAAASGLGALGATGALARVGRPWDADAVADTASDETLLWLRPGDAVARGRDAHGRVAAADGPAFRTAVGALARYGRVDLPRLLEAGQDALRRWTTRGEAEDLALGESLLRDHQRHSQGETDVAVRSWLDFAGPERDPVAVFGDLPLAARLSAGRALAEARPRAAWVLLGSVLLDPEVRIAEEERSVRALLALAASGEAADPVPALRRLLARGDFPAAVRAEAEALLARRPPGPR